MTMEFDKVYCPYSICIMDGISGETTCDREGYISLCDLYQDREECKDIANVTDENEASLALSVMEFDGLDDINDFSMSLPEITANDDDSNMSFPDITTEEVDFSASLPEITTEDDDSSMSSSETTIEDEDFSMSFPDATIEGDELIMSVPDTTTTDSPTAGESNHPTSSLVTSETNQNLSAEPSLSPVFQSPTTKKPSVRPSNKPTMTPISSPTVVG